MILYAGQKFTQSTLPFRGFYGFTVRLVTNTVPLASGWNQIIFDELADTDPDFWYHPVAGEVTVKERALVFIQLQARFGVNSNNHRGVQVLRNGVRTHIYVGAPAPSGVTILNLFWQEICDAGDVLTFEAYQNAGSINLEASPARDTRLGFAAFILP